MPMRLNGKLNILKKAYQTKPLSPFSRWEPWKQNILIAKNHFVTKGFIKLLHFRTSKRFLKKSIAKRMTIKMMVSDTCAHLVSSMNYCYELTLVALIATFLNFHKFYFFPVLFTIFSVQNEINSVKINQKGFTLIISCYFKGVDLLKTCKIALIYCGKSLLWNFLYLI